MATAVLPSISRMHAGDHYCGIYRTDEDHRRIVVDFVREGIARGEKMLYLVNIHTAAYLENLLRDEGIEMGPLVESGQLAVLSAKDTYLTDGEFIPERMIQLLKEATDAAVAEGYPALRATGEMTWALAGDPGSERLVEYEALLNNFFPGSKCIAFCQYDRRRFDAEMLTDILHTHPKVLHGTEGYDNEAMYFVPPEAFLEADRQGAVLDRWLHNLSRTDPLV